MQTAAIVTFVYALLMLGGGIAGYAKAHSMPSLISGSISAVLAAIGGVLMLGGNKAGVYLALVVGLALLVFGGKSWLFDHKPFMPRGMICVVSAVELLFLLLAMRGGGAGDMPT